jgi:hypothetical protein
MGNSDPTSTTQGGLFTPAEYLSTDALDENTARIIASAIQYIKNKEDGSDYLKADGSVDDAQETIDYHYIQKRKGSNYITEMRATFPNGHIIDPVARRKWATELLVNHMLTLKNSHAPITIFGPLDHEFIKELIIMHSALGLQGKPIIHESTGLKITDAELGTLQAEGDNLRDELRRDFKEHKTDKLDTCLDVSTLAVFDRHSLARDMWPSESDKEKAKSALKGAPDKTKGGNKMGKLSAADDKNVGNIRPGREDHDITTIKPGRAGMGG